MTEWLDPATWESVAKTAAASFAALAKLRAALARRKKARRKTDAEVAALQRDLEQLVDLMMKQTTSHGRLVEALVRLLKGLKDADVVGRASQYATLVTLQADTLGKLSDLTLRLQTAVQAQENRLKAIERAFPSPADAETTKRTRRRRKPSRIE
jgi:hypothetical protein